ncbi:MAG: transcriptional regulator [Candidatus Levybacteria bacterium CG10_big_fil_rev_8_21_14_0_10_36_7]|nr:MAG: transcriptional regulator [Candidatus Levybacteria bacterium CG10_big_fil_rev_8_21_14_0_10_36_7]
MKSHLLDFRTKNKVTQQEIAEKIGVTRQTIFAIEKGRYTPSVALALRLAKFFNVKVEEIFEIIEKN